MVIKTKSALLATLREQFAYDGDGTLPSVQEFLKENDNLEFQGEDGKPFDVAALFGKSVIKAGTKFTAPDVIAPDDEPEPKPVMSRKAATINGKMARDDAGVGLSAKSWGNIARRKSYDLKAKRGETVFPDADTAEGWGAFVRQAIANSPACRDHSELAQYSQKSFDEQILGKASSTTNNSSGGALVPDDYLPVLIELREQYGVFPRLCGTTPMSSDKLPMPRNTGDATVYWNGENAAGTESDGTFDNPTLNANKLLGINRHPFEIMNDSALNIADITARSFAREAARKIDDAAFNGDGSSTYGGFVGARAALTNLSGTIANIAGLVVASGNTFDEYAITDFTQCTGRLPVYADTGNARWVMHKQRYFSIIERLGRSVGGVTYNEFSTQRPTFMLFGYPVEFSQVMPRTDANSQVDILFGDFSLGAKYGEVRNSMALDTSEQRYFDQDQVAIRYRQRVAILINDVGNASATAASRVPGPIVGIISAAS